MVIEVFEWKGKEAVDAAHSDPVVKELWARFEAACDYIAPASVEGMDGMFPNFEAEVE